MIESMEAVKEKPVSALVVANQDVKKELLNLAMKELEGAVLTKLVGDRIAQISDYFTNLGQSASSQENLATSEVAEKFLESKRAKHLASSTLGNYKARLDLFAREYPVLPTTPEVIEQFLSQKTGVTASNYQSLLRSVYAFCQKRLGFNSPNPMLNIEPIKPKSKEPEALSEIQAKKLLDVIQTDRERGLVYLYLGQGLRLSEALRLNVDDVKVDTIDIKGKEADEPMPLLPEVREVLLKLIGNRTKKQPVFVGLQGRLKACMAALIIKELFHRAGITNVKQSPHTLRHTFGTLTVRAGIDTYSQARLMRHKISSRNSSMNLHYTHLNLDDLRKKLERYSPLRSIKSGFKENS